MKPIKEKVSITIDWDILEKLRSGAEQDDRSLSQYINLILKQYLNSKLLSNSMLPFHPLVVPSTNCDQV